LAQPLPAQAGHVTAFSGLVCRPTPPQAVQVSRELGYTPVPPQYAHSITGGASLRTPLPPQTWQVDPSYIT
jgi:hypothetical protein